VFIKFVLIQLHNPAVHQARFVADLFQLVCQGDMDGTEISTAGSKDLFKNGGKMLLSSLIALINLHNTYLNP